MSVISHFKALSQIPHCSYQTDAMKTYLIDKAKAYGYEVLTDEAGNILCQKESAAITMQSHYDMVCIGKAPLLKLEERDGWLYAADSTLGSDNGVGMAMMLALMEEGVSIDTLFTADEEVGLLGARALNLPLKTPYLLNLDSEDEGVVTVGCAGGVDIMATLPLLHKKRTLFCYEIESSGFAGGHSGVDIDKNIPNAIKELSAQLVDLDQCYVVSFKGGERRNSIAKRAVAVVGFETEQAIAGAKIVGRKEVDVMEQNVISMLHAFAHGVRNYNNELRIVQTSINLAIVEQNETEIMIHLSARSMDSDELKRLQSETVTYFESFGAAVETEGFYAPWEPEDGDFVKQVTSISQDVLGSAEVGAIHAGLECGIIKEKFPQMQMASIGPTIRYPHSTRECVELISVERVYDVVKKICECSND
ncbi:MAG: aminoacyl-histidine dipeptidase [Epsilonproteobacteria bacterium]|nr:MAG: aminoacyl-histidine dipeptidase [Campylobacterota bacterium]